MCHCGKNKTEIILHRPTGRALKTRIQYFIFGQPMNEPGTENNISVYPDDEQCIINTIEKMGGQHAHGEKSRKD